MQESQKETPTVDKKKKKKKAGPDLSMLDEKSIKILAKLILAMAELDENLEKFFEDIVY